MSLYTDFEPHSYYKGFAIKREKMEYMKRDLWRGYGVNGMTGYIVERHADTLKALKTLIKEYVDDELARIARLYA